MIAVVSCWPVALKAGARDADSYNVIAMKSTHQQISLNLLRNLIHLSPVNSTIKYVSNHKNYIVSHKLVNFRIY